MSDSIKVAIKVRPLIKRERDEGLPIQWDVQDNKIFTVDPETKKRGDCGFIFDHIFDMTQNNAQVFDTCVKQIVDAAVNGFNGTVFAYGQTSSGKTYTMMGDSSEPGVIPLAVEHMFNAIANTSGREFLLRVSYLEIYNEKVNDLLDKQATDLKVHEDYNNQVVVKCKEEVTNCPENVLTIMKKGDKNRRTGETNMNERSSRSHTIFRITIESRVQGVDSDGAVQVSQLNLVDLAGSERARQTKATGERFKEGVQINMSLSALGLVIMQLSESQDGAKYINFRDSKLTRLLQTSLGGNALTTIICNVTPAAVEETNCTLLFASRAKSIKNKPQLNEVMSDATLLKRYAKQLEKLTAELKKKNQENRCAEVEEMESKLQEKERINQLLEERIELLKTRIVSSDNSTEEESFKSKSRRRRTWCGPSAPIPFRRSLALPTIKESDNKQTINASSQKEKIKRRQSIIQTPVVDMVNENFQTEFADFELELIESERNWEAGRSSTDSLVDLEEDIYVARRRPGKSVQFKDDVSVYRLSYESTNSTPEKSDRFSLCESNDEKSPGTPKHVLRDRMTCLLDDFNELREFTTLEKQLFHEEGGRNKNLDTLEETLNHMRKSVADSEMMCLETNKKFAELQGQHSELGRKFDSAVGENQMLKNQVREMEERLGSTEMESNKIKNTMDEKLRRLKVLEDERNDYEIKIELLEKKYKAREKELENSLQLAWKSHTDTSNKEKFFDAIHLQSVIDDLTKDMESLRNNSESSIPQDHPVFIDNENMKLKLEEFEVSLKNMEEEKTGLLEQLKELSKHLEDRPTCDQLTVLKAQLEEIGSSKMGVEKINEELESKLSEALETIKNLPKTNVIDEKDREILCLNAKIAEQSSEISALKTDLQEICNKKTSLDNEVSGLHARFDQSQAELAKHNNHIDELAKSKSSLESDLTRLQTRLVSKEDEIVKLMEQLEASSKLNENSSIPTLETDFHFEIDQLKLELTDRDATISKLTDQLEQSSVMLEEENNIKSELEVLQSKGEQQEIEITNLRDRLEEASKLELKATHEFNEMVQKLDQIVSEKDRLVEENVELKSRFSETTDQLKNNENLIDTLKADIDQLKSKLEEKKTELSHMKNKLEELRNISAEVESSPEETSELTRRITALEEELKNSKKELSSRLQEISRQKSEIASLVDSVAAESNEIVTLTKTIEEMKIANARLKSTFEILTEELDQHYASNTEITRNSDTSLQEEAMNSKLNLKVKNGFEVDSSETKREIKSPRDTNRATRTQVIKSEVGCGPTETALKVAAERVQDSIVTNGSKPKVDVDLKNKIEKLIVANKSLLSENSVLKSRIKTLDDEVATLQDSMENMGIMESKLSELYSTKNSLETDLTQREGKINELQDDICKLKDQVICMQSEKTLHEGTKCAMQKTIKGKEEELQRIPKLEARVKDLELERTEFEHMNVELRKQLNGKILELDSQEAHKYESEAKNLKSYVASLELLYKNVQNENDELKALLDNRSMDLENRKRRIDELESRQQTLEEDKKNLLRRLEEFEAAANTDASDATTTISLKPISETLDKSSASKSFQNVSGSIFDVDVSYDGDDSVFEHANTEDSSLYRDIEKSNDLPTLKNAIEELEESKNRSSVDGAEFLNEMANAKDDEIRELPGEKTLLEDENAKLALELQLKNQKSDEIKNDVHALKVDIAKLHETIHLLTEENMDMSSKLNTEKERAKTAEENFQAQVDDLYARLSEITDKNVTLKNELIIHQEQLEAMRATTPIATEDQIRAKIEEYQGQINSLTEENIQLSSNLMDQIEELNKVKESKTLLYDHECTYKEQAAELSAKLDAVSHENTELSNNLMEKIEELDRLTNAYELLESKLDISMKTQVCESIAIAENDINCELKAEIVQLKADNVELKAKVATLSRENARFSDNLLETMEELDNTRQYDVEMDKSADIGLQLSIRHDDSIGEPSEDSSSGRSVEALTSRNKMLKERIDQVSRLNKKLSDLKLGSCSQCKHLKELNDSRRTLKLEVKSLNNKLHNLQRDFDRKCADTQVLRDKANEEMNLSILSDLTMNESMMEGFSMTFVEEREKNLNTEVEDLKQSRDQLSALYEEKCNELEKLQSSTGETLPRNQLSSPKGNKRASIERVQQQVDKVREEVQIIKQPYANLNESFQKYINEKSSMQNEIDSLKSCKERLNAKLIDMENTAETAQEQIRILEGEMANLNGEMEKLLSLEKESKNEKLNLEVEIECLRADKERNQQALNELKLSLNQEKENNLATLANLETLRKEREELMKLHEDKTREHETILASKLEECEKLSDKFNETFKQSEDKLREKEAKLAEYIEKNASLQEEVEKLLTLEENRDVDETEQSDNSAKVNLQSDTVAEGKVDKAKAELLSDYEDLKEELNTAKQYITKEIRSLNPKLKNDLDRSVKELITDFLKIIMMKEQEIIKSVQDSFEQDKQKLEDEKRQSVDAEKRVIVWAKELEAEIEKLQGDMCQLESKNRKLIAEIETLEQNLKESNHEKQSLKEKIEVLETDFNTMQVDLDKLRSKADVKPVASTDVMLERDRLAALQTVENREAELQSRMKAEKERYNRRIEDLTSALEGYKAKNSDLRSNIEELDTNEKQLKNIIDVRSNDLAKSQQKIEALTSENAQLAESCNQLNRTVEEKTRRIDDIAFHLKSKCDLLSEYKTKLETITPEYEILKDQIRERKASVERYRSELDILRDESQRQLDSVKDKLGEEQIKSGVLTKQLAELSNRNTALLAELEEMKEKCDELERNNDKLIHKMRNSTSKTKAEAEVEACKEQISALRQNNEGASNRIAELQESKTQSMRKLAELQGKYDMLLREKKALEKTVAANKEKSNAFDAMSLREKYEELLQDKNKIALELEDKKVLLVQRDKVCADYKEVIEDLETKNKDLDAEMDEMVQMINRQQVEINVLQDKVFEAESVVRTNGSGADSSDPSEEIQKLRRENEEQRDKIKNLMKKSDILWKENQELASKLPADFECKVETRSGSDSRSVSPLLENNRRKQRRSDLFNQNRHLDNVTDAGTTTDDEKKDCRCHVLGPKVRELELEVVSRNGKIASLEMQIQSENFPYQKKCKDLEENLLAFRSKNAELKLEVKRLQRAMTETSMRECEVCRRWRTNRRDQSTQTMPECKTFLSGTSSGVVNEHVKIQKLEKEKALMKDLCRSRMREIKELQTRVTELEARIEGDKATPCVTVEDVRRIASNESVKSSSNRDKSHVFGQSSRRAMKENLQANILDNATEVSSSRTKRIWSNYS